MMSREVMDLLERINARGTTIVMVTHAPECAARAAREIHLLDGKVIDLEAPAAGELRVRPVSASLASALA